MIATHYCMTITLCSSISKQVTYAISKLCDIFKIFFGKVLKVDEQDKLHNGVVIGLCQLEKIFSPSFFTIMVDLVIHLQFKAKLGGPIHYQ